MLLLYIIQNNTLYFPFCFQISVVRRVLPHAKRATAETLRGESALSGQ